MPTVALVQQQAAYIRRHTTATVAQYRGDMGGASMSAIERADLRQSTTGTVEDGSASSQAPMSSCSRLKSVVDAVVRADPSQILLNCLKHVRRI